MKEPTEKEINKLLKKYYKIIADIQSQCIGSIEEVRKYVFSKLKELEQEKKNSYKFVTAFIISKYTKMFLDMKTSLVNAYNTAGALEKTFAENTLGSTILYTPPVIKTFPSSRVFDVTNRILRDKSILKRNKILAGRVTKIIYDGFNSGSSIQQIQRKLDIEFGFRNKKGQITPKAKALIKEGKFVHANGHIYQTYRIARTEAMRMASIRTREIFDNIDRSDKRLKLRSTIDGRERYQSFVMNGQISDEKGRFKYPDGKYYYLGEQPKQWAINDRETSYTVFLDDPQTQQALRKQNKSRFSDFSEFEKTGKDIAAAAKKQRKNTDKAVEYVRKNTDKDLLKKFYNIGSLNTDLKNTLESETSKVKFSLDNFIKNQIKHPEISADIYKKIPDMINNADYKFKSSSNRLIFFKELDGKLYETVIKTTADKKENYLLSLHIADYSKIEKLKR